MQKQITDESVKKNELNINQNHERKRIEELKQRIEAAQKSIDDKRNIIEDESERARELGERPDEIRYLSAITFYVNVPTSF